MYEAHQHRYTYHTKQNRGSFNLLFFMIDTIS